MLGGMALADRGRVVVLGAGRAGGAAARLASDLGARVTVFDKNPMRLEELHNYSPNIAALYAYHHSIAEVVAKADLVIGAVLLPGLHAPRIVTTDMVKTMQPGSVIIDISVDQGGCVETIHATDYANPTYVQHGVVHFGVTNMPGAVPRTSSQALSAVITPYVQRLATPGWALEKDLQDGINIRDGKIDNVLIEQALG
jgi:alanine dehydrogenase